MATVAQILPDLARLASETKRKHADVRQAIEAAQSAARASAPAAQLASPELQQHVSTPFVLALASAAPRLMAAAFPPLLRLASANVLPAAAARDVLRIFAELHIPAQPVDTQFKVLQILPALTQAETLARPQFLQILAVTVALAHSPSPVVANTAAATLHQIFASLFDHVPSGPAGPPAADADAGAEAGEAPEPSGSDGSPSLVCEAFCGLAAIVAGDATELFGSAELALSPQVTLEILENVLPSNVVAFRQPDLAAALKHKLLPGLVRNLGAPSYGLSVRTLRVLHVLLATQVESLQGEIAVVLSATNQILQNADETWKRILVLEFYKAILSSFPIVKRLFEAFSGEETSILCDLWSVLNSYLDTNYKDMFCGTLITVPTEPLPPLHLSKATSSLKVPLIDHLDKTEPPGNVPELYTPSLIHRSLLSFAEGASDFVANLTNNADVNTMEQDVEFINSLIENVHRSVFEMFEKYVFCSMDTDNFRATVRALQKYTHTAGLLGLTVPRDDCLSMISSCVVKVAPPEAKKAGNAANFLAIGESIVESLSSTIQNSANSSFVQSENAVQEERDTVNSRNFNSRQVVCFRALANLASSLGSTLQDSWKHIWITFQWVDYYVNGPDQFSSFYKSKELIAAGEPKLSPQDLATIESSQEKLLESIPGYHEESFTELLSVVIGLSEAAMSEISKFSPQMCPLNQFFFLGLLSNLAKLDYSFSLYEKDHFAAIAAYFNRAATDRSMSFAKRAHIIETYSSIIVTVTQRQFKKRKNTDSSAEKSLDALYSLLEALFGLGRPSENLILNCETEMHLSILSTLHGLIDEHEEFYKNSWDVVFRILRTAFNNTGDMSSQNNKLVEKISLLISTSFETFKLILDEFLSTLPFNQLKTLTDTLVSFCSQTYDLNISFSSVSYFWLISDCINSKKGLVEAAPRTVSAIGNMTELEQLLASSTEGSGEHYEALNIYLLAKLSQLSSDSRAQVREGAIQTLFQILDVQGIQFRSWAQIYDIVFPQLLSLEGYVANADPAYRKSRIESLILVLSGLVSVYTKFLTGFDDELNEQFWRELVHYLKSVLQLHWNDLNSKVFQSYQDILLVLCKGQDVGDYMKELLFEFWIGVPIEYDFVNPEYQDSLAIYNDSFHLLYDLIGNEMEMAQANQVINNLNKCARYPVLKSGGTDDCKPTTLQKAVINNLSLIGGTHNDEILANVIQQLSQVAAYPYEIRGRIESKLKSKFDGKLKIPTFVAISQQAFELICAQMQGVKSMGVFLQAGKFQRIVRNLLELVHNRAQGVADEGTVPLWIRCNEMINHIISRVVEEHVSDIEDDAAVWQVIVDCLMVNLEGSDRDDVNVDHYQKLADKVMPIFFDLELDALASELVEKMYRQSFLYEENATERELMKGSIADGIQKLTGFRFEEEFGTTMKCQVKDHPVIRMKCMQELFRFAHVDGFCGETAKQYVVMRCAFAIRRCIADERLLNQKPMPQVQEEELHIVLAGFRQLSAALGEAEFHQLMRLIAQSAGYIERVRDRKKGRMEKWVGVAQVWERM